MKATLACRRCTAWVEPPPAMRRSCCSSRCYHISIPRTQHDGVNCSTLNIQELGATGNKGLHPQYINPALADAVAGLATSATAQATVEVGASQREMPSTASAAPAVMSVLYLLLYLVASLVVLAWLPC